MPERMMVSELERKYDAMAHELNEVEQVLAEALDYPRFVDDPQNFPQATEADGFCVGEMTPAALAEQLAKQFALQNEQNTSFLVQALTKGTETSSMAAALAQEQKDFKVLAELFEKQNEVLKTTKELLQIREKSVAMHETHARIWEREVLLVKSQYNQLQRTITAKDTYIASLEDHFDALLDLTNRFYRLVYDVPDGKMPKPEWADVPREFVWWTVDADGEPKYWADKPYADIQASMWYHNGILSDEYDCLIWQPEDASGFVEIPLGIDWRMLIRHRPKN